MRVFKSSWFAKFSAKKGITDASLKALVNDILEQDLANADLGGNVYKIRLARSGKGKSGGYRVIVFYKSENKTFFYYAYPKSLLSNISEKELRNFKRVSKAYFLMTDEQIAKAVEIGEIIEI
ncbi:MAG: type II toxin-antitoxin system RelE/ParE family toxin [Treponema sp.]|nr:type II toxin-antitoxin system RelE/ParE family toxin [Treponema sp.]MCL2238112.1 type II toxin-antitoxin system RelE/ParE family toxin [Treponema sp.]